ADPPAVALFSHCSVIAGQSNAAPADTGELAEDPQSVSGDFVVPHYVRFVVKDRPGIVAEVAAVFARFGISIDALLQKTRYPHSALPFIMTLESCSSPLL